MVSFPPPDAFFNRQIPQDYPLVCPKCQQVFKEVVFDVDASVWYNDQNEEVIISGDPQGICMLFVSPTPHPLVVGLRCFHKC
jgi:hypothetical protein